MSKSGFFLVIGLLTIINPAWPVIYPRAKPVATISVAQEKSDGVENSHLRKFNNDLFDIYVALSFASDGENRSYEYKDYKGDFSGFFNAKHDRTAIGMGGAYFLNSWLGVDANFLWSGESLIVDDVSCNKVGTSRCGGNGNTNGISFYTVLKLSIGPTVRIPLFSIGNTAFVSLRVSPYFRYSRMKFDDITTRTLLGFSDVERHSPEFVSNTALYIHFGDFSRENQVSIVNSYYIACGFEYSTSNLEIPHLNKKWDNTNVFVYLKLGIGFFSVSE